MRSECVSKQFAIELSLQALTIELNNLLTLEHQLEETAKQVLRDCNFKINQLIRQKVA